MAQGAQTRAILLALGGGAVLVVLVVIFIGIRSTILDSNGPGSADTTVANLPALRQAVKDAQVAYPLADNDLKKSEIRKNRDTAVAAAVPNGDFSKWPGTLESLTTDHAGDASIGVKLDGCECGLVTADSAEIKLGSPLFEQIKQMKQGDHVLVSGHMFDESSITEWGSVDDPEWNTRFDDVSLAPLPPKALATPLPPKAFAWRVGQPLPPGVVLHEGATLPDGYDLQSGMTHNCTLPDCMWLVQSSTVPHSPTTATNPAQNTVVNAATSDIGQEADAAYSHGDYVTALKDYSSLAAQGNVAGQIDLGVMYQLGQGVPQDYAEAVQWFRRAADQGNADGQNNLGLMYSNGQGVPQDYATAVQWFRRAADQGNAKAQNNLGVMYQFGQGVPQDYAEAVQWFRRAADQGNPDGQTGLGFMYANGRGVPQDYTQALTWYRKAADQGNAVAQSNITDLYARFPTLREQSTSAVSSQAVAAGADNHEGETYEQDKVWGDRIEHGACTRLRDRRTDSPADIAECNHDYAMTPLCISYKGFASAWYDMANDPNPAVSSPAFAMANLNDIGTKGLITDPPYYRSTPFRESLRRLLNVAFSPARTKWSTRDQFADYAYKACMEGHSF